MLTISKSIPLSIVNRSGQGIHRLKNVPREVKRIGSVRYGGPPVLHTLVQPGLEIWWAKKIPVNGQVIEYLSPNELRMYEPFIKKIPKRVYKVFQDHWHTHWIPASFTFALLYWAKNQVAMEHYKHRD